MSGSGGGGFGGSWGTQVSCSALVIHTQLSSPEPSVVSRLETDAILTVEVEKTGNISLVVAKYHGEIAGGLASAQISRLIECIADGTRYQAIVRSKEGGQVRVKVEAVK